LLFWSKLERISWAGDIFIWIWWQLLLRINSESTRCFKSNTNNILVVSLLNYSFCLATMSKKFRKVLKPWKRVISRNIMTFLKIKLEFWITPIIRKTLLIIKFHLSTMVVLQLHTPQAEAKISARMKESLTFRSLYLLADLWILI